MQALIFPPGSVLSLNVGPFLHYGIASERWIGNEQMVLSCSRRLGRMTEEKISDFAAGRAIKNHGFKGNLPPLEVVLRARQLLGKPWNLLSFNCEQAMRLAVGEQPRSYQLMAAGTIGFAFVVGVVAFSSTRWRRA